MHVLWFRKQLVKILNNGVATSIIVLFDAIPFQEDLINFYKYSQ